jgi:hypothetical protein
MKRVILAVVATAFAATAYAGPMFTLIPTDATTNVPGGITGWGYDIKNTDLANFLVLNDSFASGSLAAGTYGTYVDYLASNFIVIGPNGDSGPVAFNQGTSGVGEFDFNQFVPNPTHVPGDISIDYSLFSQDPNSPTFDPGSFVTSGTVSATAEASVVPEPASELLAGLMLVPFAFAVLRYRRAGHR